MKVTDIFDKGRRYRLECGHVNPVPPGLTGFQLPRVGQSWPCAHCTRREQDFPWKRDTASELDKARGTATLRPDVTVPAADGRFRQTGDIVLAEYEARGLGPDT